MEHHLEKLEQSIGYTFNNKNLLITALTHTSYAYENKVKSYERLEYLGDSILEFISSKFLFKNYNNLSEGEMTKVRASYVCENANFCYATSLNLQDYMLLGHGEQKDGMKKAIVADIFEALMGAIYIDLGYATARKVILSIVTPYIEDPNITFFNDYKSALQEYVQTNQQLIEYTTVNEEGPAHDKTFTVEVKIDDIVYGTGTGNSKKEAEQEAAKEALDKVVK